MATFEPEGYTYDDIMLKVRYSDVDPRTVSLESLFSQHIPIKIPLVSAAMDTVTEAKLAIALALEGGIGVIHKNLPPQEQAREVRAVKRFENGFIHDPVTLPPNATLGEARAIPYHGIPITEDGRSDGRLVGLLTNKDYYFDDPDDDPISDYMVPFDDLVLGEEGIRLDEANRLLKETKVGMVLVVNNRSERRLRSIVCRKDVEKNLMFPMSCKDDQKRLRVAAAIGPFDVEGRAEALVKAGADAIVVDTAHGHTRNVLEAVKHLKGSFPVDVVAGNVATREGALALAEAGADGVKVGIGPGAICTTRIVTGVGVPQATAVHACAEALKGTGIPVIADGGIQYSGDIAKAIGLGAHAVMVGSLLAGTDEAPGEIIFTEDNRRMKLYRGMGSVGAMAKGSADRYGQAGQAANKFVPEGIEGVVPAVGPLSGIVYQLMGGLRQAMGYVGARTIPEMHERAVFIVASTASRESHPRVPLVKRAPNYPTG